MVAYLKVTHRFVSKKSDRSTKNQLHVVIAMVVLSLTSGCVGHIEGSDAATMVLNMVRDLQVMVIVKQILIWTILGTVGGIVVTIVANNLSRPENPTLEVTWVKVARIVTFSIVGVMCAWLGGCSGAMEGGLRGTNKALNESVIGQQLLPKTAGYCADVIQFIAVSCERISSGVSSNNAAPFNSSDCVTAFRDGKSTFDATAMSANIHKGTSQAAEKIRNCAKSMVFNLEPEWKDGKGEVILNYGLDWTIRNTLPAANDDLTGAYTNSTQFVRALEQQLIADYGTAKVTREQLSSVIVTKYFMPTILFPLKVPVRAHEYSTLIFMAWILGVPLAIFRIARAKNK